MRPTRRGVGVLLAAAVATVIWFRFGQPGLAVIVGSVVVAFAVAVGQLSLAGTPTVERSVPRRGFPGDRRTVEVTVDGGGIARIRDRLPEGIGGETDSVRSLPTTVGYEVIYRQRGEHRIGPAELTLTDALGLVVTETTAETTDDVLVYPTVSQLGDAGGFFQGLTPDADDEASFDYLREYVPGDPPRQIHWKSSAKRDDLLVAERSAHSGDPGVRIVVTAESDHGDEMAAAGATVALAALDSELAVELTTPERTVQRGNGDAHRTRLLEALARASSGDTGREDEADILISATDDGVAVAVGDRRQAFETLTVDADRTAVREGLP